MIAMEMAVNHPFNGLAGHLTDTIEEVAPLAWVRARIDQEHAFLRDEKHRIRPAEVEKELNVVCDPFDDRFLRRA
jgi:hypothetical protein